MNPVFKRSTCHSATASQPTKESIFFFGLKIVFLNSRPFLFPPLFLALVVGDRASEYEVGSSRKYLLTRARFHGKIFSSP